MKMRNTEPIIRLFHFVQAYRLIFKFFKSIISNGGCNADAFYPSCLSPNQAASQLRSFQLPSSSAWAVFLFLVWGKGRAIVLVEVQSCGSSSSDEKVLSAFVESVGLYQTFARI